MTHNVLPPLTIGDAAAALRRGELTSVELTECALAQVRRFDDQWGVYLTRFPEQALEAAQSADGTFRAGLDLGPLQGITLGVKDLITTDEGPTTAQSLVHDPESSQGDAPVVSRLRAAGMVVVGKTTTMEFGVGRPDPAKPFPLPRNPWNPRHWTGGSSSGSASAVAAGMALGTLGTDTGGSVRIPAAFCGITGLKQTYGLVPKSGCVPLGYSLDHIGPMARSARDCALMLEVMAGADRSDPTTVDREVPAYSRALTGDLTGLRIGVDRLTRHAGTEDPALADTFDSAIAVLAELGAEIVEIELPHYAEMGEVYNVTMSGEALAYHAPDLEAHWEDYFAATRSVLGKGVFYTAADYVQAQRIRRVGQQALARMFADIDLIVTPTTSIAAPRVEELASYYSASGLRALHTEYWNAVGNPALTVPMGFNADGLPLGLQIAGPAFDDATVLRAGDAFQRFTEWHLQVPPLVSGEEWVDDLDGGLTHAQGDPGLNSSTRPLPGSAA